MTLSRQARPVLLVRTGVSLLDRRPARSHAGAHDRTARRASELRLQRATCSARLLKEQGRFDEALSELDFSERLQYSTCHDRSSNAPRSKRIAANPSGRAPLSPSSPICRNAAGGLAADRRRPCQARRHRRRHSRGSTRGYATRDNTLLSIATSPLLAPLQGRRHGFADLLRRLHFASAPAGTAPPRPTAGDLEPAANRIRAASSSSGRFSHPSLTGTS